VAVFGVGSYATSKHGTGAADVYNRNTVNLRSGFENAGYNVTNNSGYWDAVRAAFDARVTLTTRNIDYASVEQALTAETVQPSVATDTAVYIVTRGWTGGIDKSRGPGCFELSETEQQNLRLGASTYEHVVVVLNTGSVFGTSFYDGINGSVSDPADGQALDAILLAGLPGQQVGNAIVDVLDGTVNPSGKVTDTWASTYDHYPAAATFSDHDGITDTRSTPRGYTSVPLLRLFLPSSRFGSSLGRRGASFDPEWAGSPLTHGRGAGFAGTFRGTFRGRWPLVTALL